MKKREKVLFDSIPGIVCINREKEMKKREKVLFDIIDNIVLVCISV